MKILDWLGLAFVVLKLTGYIDWSWWWVLAPFWGWAPLWVLGWALKKIHRATMSPEEKKIADLRESLLEYGKAVRGRKGRD